MPGGLEGRCVVLDLVWEHKSLLSIATRSPYPASAHVDASEGQVKLSPEDRECGLQSFSAGDQRFGPGQVAVSA